MKTPLSGMIPEEIFNILELEKPYRGLQIFKALHAGAEDFSSITTLPLSLRESFSERFTLLETKIQKTLKDEDNNGKLSVLLTDGNSVECVLIADLSGRKTACLSTQAGCAMGCRFCKTGEGGFFRNLTAPEIVEQLLHLEKSFGRISNIVYMGMGEPLENLENLFRASEIFNHDQGKGISYRRMTVSTCGLADRINSLADNGPPFRLAVSLNSAIQEKREKIMPVSLKFPVDELKESLTFYQKQREKRITLEYVLIKGFNTGEEDARALRSFVSGLSAIINLIPWNPAPGLDFETPSRKEIDRFCQYLDSFGILYSLRRRKGDKISGACGQLASREQAAPSEDGAVSGIKEKSGNPYENDCSLDPYADIDA